VKEETEVKVTWRFAWALWWRWMVIWACFFGGALPAGLLYLSSTGYYGLLAKIFLLTPRVLGSSISSHYRGG